MDTSDQRYAQFPPPRPATTGEAIRFLVGLSVFIVAVVWILL